LASTTSIVVVDSQSAFAALFHSSPHLSALIGACRRRGGVA
jgi:hypothetical protein